MGGAVLLLLLLDEAVDIHGQLCGELTIRPVLKATCTTLPVLSGEESIMPRLAGIMKVPECQ